LIKRKNYKSDLDEIAEGYQVARDCEFDTKLTDFIRKTREADGVVTEDDIQGFIDSFEFIEENEWCEMEYAEQIGAFEDVKYNEIKDKR